jgi:hypothetical protein
MIVRAPQSRKIKAETDSIVILKVRRIFDIALAVFGIAVIALFVTRYRMPFRLDDILLMEWSLAHHWWQAFDPIAGQLVNSYRPMYSLTSFVLTHLAGWEHPFWWHLALCTSLAIGIGFAALTVREITGRWYATQIVVLLYPLAFATILNVFFWFSDLTYGLELMFTCVAWYLGLRALRENRFGMWCVALALGALAVLSKEPAFVLVHVVLGGTLLMDKEYRVRKQYWFAYAALIVLSLFVVASSPTRSNRFFSLSSPGISAVIGERMDYYGSIYCSFAVRVLVFFPIVYARMRIGLQTGRMLRTMVLTVISLVLSIVAFSNLNFAMIFFAILMVALAFKKHEDQAVVRRFLPFFVCIVFAVGALLVTVQEVKTQLTEVAILSVMIASWGWCVWAEDLRAALHSLASPLHRRLIVGTAIVLESFSIVAMVPRMKGQEKMLRAVRDVRQNANDALTWTSKNLPQNSVFATTLYSLHGIEHQNLLTPKDDSTKLRAQYTFDGGFVYHVLEVLGRRDIQHAYLADSGLLPRVLTAMRETPNAYLFLQSGLDLDLFHGHPSLITNRDSLVAKFDKGPYPSEIWLLRR